MTCPGAPRILIVDDNPGDAALARKALRAGDLHPSVQHRSTLADAEALVRSGDVDLVLLDLCLGGTEGAETVRRMRSCSADVPIVVLTGADEERALVEALEADADDFLPKEHVSADNLERALRHACERRRLTLELRRQQRELTQSESRLKAVLSTVSDGIVVADAHGRILFHNHATPRLLGREEPDLEGRVIHELANEHTDLLEFPVEPGAGRSRTVELTGAAIRWEGRDARVWSLRDVTARRRLESRVRAVERIEAVGQLTGGLAHEMNNVLAVIVVNAGLLADEPDADERRSLVKEVEEASQRGTRVVGRLLAYARRRRLRTATKDVADIIRERIGALADGLPTRMEIELRLPDIPCSARVDEDAVEQILRNLLRNAHEAAPASGARIFVEVSAHELEDADHGTGAEIRPGHYVRMSVTDNGHGMDRETVERAFEPFFTTKGGEKGSGLGLATVYGLTKQQDGYVFLTSQPGEGTSVDVYFPMARGTVEEASADAEPPSRVAGNETILLAEDEQKVRRTTARILRRFGYDVVEVSDGLEALQALRDAPQPIDLIVSDVVMPNLGGHGLLEALSDVAGAPPILFVSGYSSEDVRRGALLDPSLPLLHKPWRPPELLQAVRATLGNGLSGSRRA